jgi:cytochrome c-type biogenesis protein
LRVAEAGRPAAPLRGLLAAIGFITLLAVVAEVTRGHTSAALLRFTGDRLNELASQVNAANLSDGNRLYAFAFAGGLVASISPCILAMLPINLTYIGSAKVSSRSAAVRLATAFVLGIGLVNVTLGLSASLFFAAFVQYRAQVNIVAGVVTALAALWMLGIIRVRVPNIVRTIPKDAGPFVIGVATGLVTSPCSSPVLVTILAAASKSGDAARAALAMIAYTFGYSAVVWLASVFAGVAAASRTLLRHGVLITRMSALGLGVIGIATISYGFSLLF